MTAVSMPLTFQNSFWSQDYRRGLEVLYSQLEQGIAENEDIVAFIRARSAAETAIAVALAKPAAGNAFDIEDGASLQMTVNGLKEETKAQGKVHESIAKDLEEKIAAPFEEWAEGYKERLLSSKANIVDGYLHAYEIANGEVARLKEVYLAKTRKADEAEDDARFAPVSQPVGDKYTSSPVLGPRDKRPHPRAPSRQPTMSERITARLKEFRLNASTLPRDAKPEVQFDADAEETKEKGEEVVEPPKLDKGKGRAVEFEEPPILASPPPLSPALPPARLNTDVQPTTTGGPIIVAGVSFTPGQLSQLLTKAKEQLPLRSVRFPLLGEYQNAFTGEEFAAWLKENVKPFEGSLDRAEEAAADLTEAHNLLRRLGELGNEFEDADDAWYQFRPKAFNLDGSKPQEPGSAGLSPLAPIADGVTKQTGAFASLVSKALNTTNANTDPPHVRARKEADAADQEYRASIRKLDRQRLGLEERIEDTLKTLQKWELDRLRAVKTVLTQYHNCIEGGPKGLGSSLDHSSTLIAAYHPEADLKALIEQYRTGPFRPTAHVYESVAHDEADVVFGIDLRKWADLGIWPHNESSPEKKDVLPPVLVVLLKGLKDAYPKLPSDAERRKTWIYEVPLPAVHHLRETLNSIPPEKDIPEDILVKYDPPVLASTIRLWALELDPPLCMYEGWDEFRKLYPSVGAVKPEEQPSEEKRIHELQNALQKLPRIHLFVLDALVKHLKELINETSEEGEPTDTYIAKLALSLGRTILRPRVETKFSIQDRHPTMLFVDLIKKYDEILPPTIAKKKRESERKVPVRRRTRPVDMRMSRSRISAGADLKELHAAQMAHRGLRSPPPVPPIPTNLTAVPETRITPPTPAGAEIPVVTAEPESFHDEPEEISLDDQRSVEPTPAPASEVPAPVSAAEPVAAPAPVSPPAVPPPPPAFANIPPPPPLKSTLTPPPPPPFQSTDIPPTFKEPPPEVDDDLPPRPSFKEPPPEHEETELPMPNFPDRAASPPLPMPNFADPPAEPLTPPASRSPPAFNTSSRPTSPRSTTGKSTSPPPRRGSRGGSISSRNSSPNKAEAQAGNDNSSGSGNPNRISRVGGVRGPRGLGNAGGGNVGNMVKNFNRTSASFANGTTVVGRTGSPTGSSFGARARGTSSAGTAGSGSGNGPMSSHAKRSSASRSSLFERRTMASDAEEEVVQ